MTKYLESRESSSPIITRAVAAGLNGEPNDAYEFDPITKTLLKIVGAFPKELAEWLVPRAGNTNALDGNRVRELNIDDLIRGRLQDYQNTKGPFPAITMGVGMGGTTAHLALGLGGPFLPQAFVMTVKNGSMDGNVRHYYELSAEIARTVTKNNPNVMSIQHYDPIHDGWLVRRVNHLRLKLIELPDLYKEFIKSNLQPGGEIVYLEGKARWQQYQVGDRNVFQVGGWGDISDHEFLEGSERIKNYCEKEGITSMDWRLPDFPLINGYESEWGSEPGLGEALEEFCRHEGFQFHKISFDDPNRFNQLVFEASKKILELEGREPAGTLVEIFSQYDTTTVADSGLVPLWLIFNTKDSVRFLKQMTKKFPKSKPVFFSPLSTFSLTPDMAKWEEWEDALQGFDWVNIGTRRSHYPSDTRTLVGWKEPLRKWAKENYAPIKTRMTGKMLKELEQRIKKEQN
jgi:hypothetical protein